MNNYEKTIKLSHKEIAAKVNIETGDITTFETKQKHQPRDKSMDYFESDQPYKRQFYKAWELLETQTSALEFRVAEKLGRIAAVYTNSLAPLSPESTKVELSEALGIDRSMVEKTIDKLFKLGVIGKFEVYDRLEKHHKFWLFNPYLSFNGKVIKRDVKTLFDKTFYANII
jgi:hypothetical protein